MTDQKHDQLRRLFDRALELPAKARTAFLDSKCAGDADLKRRLIGMLAAATGEHPEPPPEAEPKPLRTEPAAVASLHEGPGTCIGPYKLLQLIGEGGFGAVFMAEQEKPVARRVALKIIKLGMDTRQVVARFEQERQALALMDHPNIARVLDAGATETGRPYFVMDLVKGDPIGEYCDKNKVSIAERLELFAQVCGAVQHAHGKGIIHRDIKPSNVLVTTREGKPQAKVIDFGIAKATSSKLTDKTLFTEHQQVIGTLQYMSPEQAEGSLDIDTRTDVYSLGVLLYELLTGSTPFDKNTLDKAMYGEIQRMIREVDPPKPSTRISASHEGLASIAAQRRVEPRRLGSLIRGELDWIVMKALEKDRSRRYETANGLAMDIRRYLAGEAIAAAPPSAAYRLRKLVRRNQGTVLAVAAVTAALVIGVIGFAWQAQIAKSQRDLAVTARVAEEKERKRAESNEKKAAATNQFLLDMLGSADLRALGREAKVAQALDKAAATVGKSFSERPEVEAAIRNILGRTYTSIGMLDEAGPQLEAALALHRKVHGEASTEFATCLHDLATYKSDRGDHEAAAELHRKAVEIGKKSLGPEAQLTLAWQADLANALAGLKRAADAAQLLRETLATQTRVFGRETSDALVMINSLAVVLHGGGRLDEAEALYREAFATGAKVLGPEHADTLTAGMNLASILHSQKRSAEAEPLFLKTYAGIKKVFGDAHHQTATAAWVLARFFEEQRRYADGLPLAETCLAARIRIEGERSEGVARANQLLASLAQGVGDQARAAEVQTKCVSGYIATLGENHETTLWARWTLAKYLMWIYRFAESEKLLKDLLEVCPKVLGEDHKLTIYVMNTYGLLRIQQERFAEAEPFLTKSLALGRRVEGEDSSGTLATQHNLAVVLRGLGQIEAAEALGRDTLERYGRTLGKDHTTTATARVSYGTTLAALARNPEAEAEFTAAIAVLKTGMGRDNPAFCGPALCLGKLLLDQGRTSEAEPILREAADVSARVRGLADPRTANLRGELAVCRAKPGHFAAAEALLLESHGVVAKALGAGHSDTRRAVHNLARVYAAWNAAEPDASRASKAREWQSKADAQR